MAGVVVVTLVALAAFDVGAVTTMRRYLLAQTDNNLQVALTLTLPSWPASWLRSLPPVGQRPHARCPRQFGSRANVGSRRSPAPSTSPSCPSAAGR